MTVSALPRVRFPDHGDTFDAQDRRDFAEGSNVTTLIPAEKRPERPATTVDRVILSCDDGCHWMLHGHDSVAREFSNFEEALDSARRSPRSTTGTVEVWQSGEYICCLPLDKWLPGDGSTRAYGYPRRARTTSERYTNRVAEVVFATAGPLFWLALIFVALAASLGWRLLLL
jgi:hypothetical protein